MNQQPLTPTGYELLTQSVYRAMLSAEGVENVEVLHNESIVGRSGAKHQVDVLWRFRHAKVEHIVLVECKNYSSSIEIGQVRDFLSVVNDIPGARGIMVTRVGYQKGAAQLAEYHGIGLKVLRPPLAEDLEGRLRDIQLNVKLRMLSTRPEHAIQIRWDPLARDQSQLDRLRTAHVPGDQTTSQIYDANGKVVVSDLGRWLRESLPVLTKEPGGPYRHVIELTDSYFKLILADGTVELVKAEKVNVDFYVEGMDEKIYTMADQVVRYIIKDFISGELEYVIRTPSV